MKKWLHFISAVCVPVSIIAAILRNWDLCYIAQIVAVADIYLSVFMQAKSIKLKSIAMIISGIIAQIFYTLTRIGVFTYNFSDFASGIVYNEAKLFPLMLLRTQLMLIFTSMIMYAIYFICFDLHISSEEN